MSGPARVAYLAPWVDLGGSDTGTVDWFRWLDRTRYTASLITTQPSSNRRLRDVAPHAEEVWPLPQLMSGHVMPRFVMDFIVSRGVRVLHVMNARLAFELLPDLAALDDPPVVVVQLHVEEEDRSGYVRLATTRFGNLVDAFSVSSAHLAAAVEGYGVRRERISVIPTGVDADGAFDPARVRPLDLGPGPHVLYPGRLTAQKDPELMVEVAAAVHARRPEVRFHVVGEGELEAPVRAAVARAGLDGAVAFHPPNTEMAPWYAACDALLMTSRYEGVPYVLYEAMAMELACVVPALPGNAELLGDAGRLVAPREDAEAYATALLELLGAPEVAAQLGVRARARVREHGSVQDMAAAHADLYDELLCARPPRRRTLAPAPRPAPIRLPTRPGFGQPLVSVVVPCFDDGRFLPDALASIRAQDYPAVEVIVVDDASGDAETRALLEDLEQDPGITLLRQSVNAGPSAARNRGIAAATGRYVLPVDADNVLLPEAISSLVRQLQEAGERVGFVYPNLQYFGNRHDYFEAPHFDLHRLREANYCDTCSLIDRSVFDAGFTFPEDVRDGHEDWDFFLAVASHGILGQAADGATLLYRKTGFSRSDVVEYRVTPFAEDVRTRHPALHPAEARRVDPAAARRQEAALKARWQPGLSVLLLEDVDHEAPAGRRLLERFAAQSVADAELIAPFATAVAPGEAGPHVRRLPPALPDRLTGLMAMARANYVVVVQRGAEELLQVPGFLERLLYARREAGASVALAFADGGPAFGGLAFDVLEDVPAGASPSAVALFERHTVSRVPALTTGPGEDEVGAIVRLLEEEHVLQWRHAPAPPAAPGSGGQRYVPPDGPADARGRAQEEERRFAQPLLPAAPVVRRWKGSAWPAWTPPETDVLVRFKQVGGEGRVVALGRETPEGYEPEHWLGAVQRFGPPGTARIEAEVDADGLQVGFHTIAASAPGGPALLGHVEEAALPLLQALHVVRVPGTQQRTLVAGAEDALAGVAELEAFLGYVEAFPNLPAAPAYSTPPSRRQPVLVRAIGKRFHAHGVEEDVSGTVVATLGRLLRVAVPDSVPVRALPDGRLATGRYVPHLQGRRAAQVARWVGAPVTWRGTAPLPARGGSALGRLRGAARGRPAPDPVGATIGHVHASAGPGRMELFSALHPVTGDQLVTPFVLEATDMGYGAVTSLGFVRGALEDVRIEDYRVPWASRHGLGVRRR